MNAAGIYPPSTLESATVELYRRTFDVNVLGTLLVTQAAAPHMADGGAVVNFASIDAFVPSPGQLLYCASKAAVVALTRSLALELAATPEEMADLVWFLAAGGGAAYVTGETLTATGGSAFR